MQPSTPELDSILLGKYRVTRILGEGGMGVVVEATHLELEQSVAIKLLAAHSGHEEEMLARFRNEARITARLPAEHVVRALDAGLTDEGQPYLVMEMLAGRDLDAELEARGRLPVSEAVDYVLQACEGLAEAHAIRLVHHDLKPANLFLTRTRDGEPLVKVVDFGIATSLPGIEIPASAEQRLCGTPAYMAPEQFSLRANVDARCDQYAIAMVLFELIAGIAPFSGDDLEDTIFKVLHDPAPRLSTCAPNVPHALDVAIAQALSKAPDDRFPDLAAFALAIAPFGSDPQAHVSAERVRTVLDFGPATAVERRRSARRELATRVASVVAAAALAAGCAVAARPLLADADERALGTGAMPPPIAARPTQAPPPPRTPPRDHAVRRGAAALPIEQETPPVQPRPFPGDGELDVTGEHWPLPAPAPPFAPATVLSARR